ncbi:S41 family peptidase [Raineya orbicola]|uniref:Prc: C-terminal processing peptidase n=1 Tax=Raineya orbicola TaxID=2016530 RepID=A0A2N3I8K9_9BACT|nr:S41 family peptidase [Raineya orbicola]PKQ66573.1 prc: C-terminal processing peptidase [Raineya orbicola]
MKKRLVFISGTAAVVALAFVLFAFNKEPQDNAFEIAKNLQIFTTLYKEVNSYYVDELNPSKTMRTSIDAMMKSLDPYTVFISEDEIEDYRTRTTGEYGGIGATIGTRNNKVLVIMPHEDTPAKRAGLKIGDEILQINEVKVNAKNYNDVSKLLKGQPGTEVELIIKRYGATQTEKVKIKRERIKINHLPYYDIFEGNIGYVQLTEFTAGAAHSIQKAVEELKNKGAKSIILDLRGNPGGLLHEAINLANLFIPKDVDVVSTKGKIAEWNKTYKTLKMPLDMAIPLVVLINGNSASASEIVAGVIQDYDRGVLVGQRSFGKGLVQSTRLLAYNCQAKITVAKYYTPSGRCIQAIDYSQKDKDGKAGKIPDSLRRAFKTRAGRTVYDGAGLEPDIVLEKEELSPIAQNLIAKNLLFEYANEYVLKNPQPNVKSAKDFVLSDADYQNFVAWVKNKDYAYTTDLEKNFQNLVETAKKEKVYDNLQSDFNLLKSKIAKNKEADLTTFKNEIRELLEMEICTRYFYEKGQVEARFDDDKELAEAIKILKEPKRYQEILKKK